MNLPPTPLETLRRAQEIANRKLKYVYVGNTPELGADYTYCPACRNPLIERTGYRTRLTGLQEHHCNKCGTRIPIVS